MRRSGIVSAVPLAVLCIAMLGQRQPILADVVVLTNGKSLEGRVTRDGDSIVIDMAQGQVRVPRDKVRSIQPKRTPLDEYAEKRQQIQQDFTNGKILAPEAADRWYDVAVWAGELNLTRPREEALKNTLSLNADHEEARKASGFFKHDGKWLTFTERNIALGFVFFEGRWVPPEAVDHVKKIRAK